MRALVVTSGGTEVAEVAEPRPGTDEVVVQVEACGICGSDVHMIERQAAAPGQVLGHEFSGRIVAAGRDVAGWRIGQAVAVNPLGACGHCPLCRRGLAFLCDALPNLGLGAPGAFAEYVAVRRGQLIALPEGVDAELGSHAEPLAVALRAVELGGVRPGDHVLVFGVGNIGLNVILASRLSGAGSIVAVGRSPGRRAAAASLGADVVVDSGETDVTAFCADAGMAFASAYECSGAPEALAGTLGLLEAGGVAVQVALGAEPAALDTRLLAGRGLRVVGSCAFAPGTFAAAVDHLVAGRVVAGTLVSERLQLAAASDALVRLRSPGDLVRVLVQPWR